MKLPYEMSSKKQCSNLSVLDHNFLTENVPCESYSMCVQGVWWEDDDQNQNILFVCIPWIGHFFTLQNASNLFSCSLITALRRGKTSTAETWRGTGSYQRWIQKVRIDKSVICQNHLATPLAPSFSLTKYFSKWHLTAPLHFLFGFT